MRARRRGTVICGVMLVLAATPALAQTRAKGPWWPHPVWGPDDQAGASNWITPAKILAALRLVQTGKVYELGQPYENDMAIPLGRAYRGALARARIEEATIQPGDAIFFRYGVAKLWKQAIGMTRRPTGIGMEVARWLVERQPSMVGSDAGGLEVAAGAGLAFPVHHELITRNGIYNLENMTFEDLVADGVHEFLFIVTPIRFVGATGSPGRPLAIR